MKKLLGAEVEKIIKPISTSDGAGVKLKNKANEELSKIFYNDAKKVGKY